MKLYMFRKVPLSIIRSLFTVHSAIVYVIQVCRELSSRSICSCSTAVYKPVWHIPLLSVQWINSWWWTDELSETCTVSCQNKCEKLVNLVEPFFYYQLMHITLKNADLLKHSKLDKNAPTCFGLHRNHLQGAKVSAWLKIIPSHSARYTRLTGHNMQP